MSAVNDEQRRRSYLGLVGMLVGLLLGAIVLYAATGPPHLPAQMPSWDVFRATLRGSSLSLGVLAYILSTAAWVVWFWIVGSLLFRVLVLTIDAITHGAAWVATLRALSDRVTLPVVRRAVDGAVVAVFVVNVASRTISGAAAASLPAAAAPHVAALQSHALTSASDPATRTAQKTQEATYTVQAGDTLWGIAQRYYGTGYEFPRLVTANVGRQMTDSERFTAAGVIQPGWILVIPLANQTVSEANGVHYYVVEEGDTLQGIAARFLGSEEKWPKLFEVNRGAARLNGHVLTDPDLIWPGLRLTLPQPAPHITSPHPAPASHHPSPGMEKPRKNPPRRRLSPTPKVPTATLLPPSPTSRPAAPTSTPTASSGPAITVPGTETDLIVGVAGAAAVAVAGGAMLLARRRVRRSLDEPPISTPFRSQPMDEFAEADPAWALAHRLNSGEMEPIILLVAEVHRFLVHSGIHDASVVWVRQARNMVTMVLRVPPQHRERVVELAKELGTRLGGKGRASISRDHDVVLQLSSLSLTGLAVQWRADGTDRLHLVPLGVLPDDQKVYGNWDELGHILLVGRPGGRTDVMLTSLVASLAARCPPEELRLVTIADRHILPAQLLGLPHHAGDFIDPVDEEAVSETLEQLRKELLRRMRRAEREGRDRWRATPEESELVLVVGELADLPDDGTTLELIGSHGACYGVRLLAATAHTDTLTADVLTHFETLAVLQTLDDDESIHLIGQPEAAVLTDGELYLRIDGRLPMRLRGFRVSSEHLDELVRLMREVYGDIPPTAPFSIHQDNEENADSRTNSEEEMAPGNGVEIVPEAADTEELPGVPLVETVEASNGHQDAIGTVLIEETIPAASTPDQEPANRALIEVRCFGDFMVTSGDREISPSGEEGASYKAWEVLAFLAAQPVGAVAKEKIFAAIWPDVDAERAGTRLRTALKRLRALLAEQVPDLSGDVVYSERDGIRRLDTTLVTSDVHRFIALLRPATKLPPVEAKVALQQARELYHGDLFSGRAGRFYEWAEERDESGVTLREYYREEYYRATQRLARLHYAAGQAALAVPLYKELLKAEPTLEDVVRDLYRCYQELQDKNSLIREDRRLRLALREAYADCGEPEGGADDIQPEPETVALFNEIRGELEVCRTRPSDT